MIHHFYRSKSDIENLSRLKTLPLDEEFFDYRGIVVNKPWGYEYLMFQNAAAAAWVLYLKHDHATSMHCHPNKKTSLIVLSGEVTCSTIEGWLHLKAGDSVIIDRGVFHTTRSLSKEGVLLIEVESPPNKKDLVRLKDAYGRENTGYEGVGSMSRDLSLYEYADFHVKRKKIRLGDALITLEDTRRVPTCSLVCLLQGTLMDKGGGVHVYTGEAASITGSSRLTGSNDILYLALTYGKAR